MSANKIYLSILSVLAKLVRGPQPDPELFREDFEIANKHLRFERLKNGDYRDDETQAIWVRWVEDQAWLDRQW